MSVVILPRPYAAAHVAAGPVMVIGTFECRGIVSWLCITVDGSVEMLPFEGIKIDFRYDWKSNQWVDVSYTTDLEDELDDGEQSEDETADYGSAAIP